MAAPRSRSCAVAILAAGEGTRMLSRRPKPLHEVGGAPLLHHAMRAAETLEPEAMVVVVGHGGREVAAAALALRPGVRIVEQTERLGTGHAMRCALPALDGFEGDIVALYADTPLVTAASLGRMRAARDAGAAVVALGFHAAVPGGYGRLILDPAGGLARIVEAADADEATRASTLCNSGLMTFDAAQGRRWLAALSTANAKGEYYLTDLVAAARAEGLPCAVALCPEAETLGVNDRADLARAEATFQARARAAAMAGGATLVAPETVFLAWDTRLAPDVEIGPHVVFGTGVVVESGATIYAFSHLERCHVGPGAVIGPHARLRPGAEIGAGARVGNFVEVKNARLGPGAKANHLAYLGDATVGAGANIGAGAITCNYDGVKKHRTEIGEGAFIGSNAALVAPVTIGAGAYVASGSVVTTNVAPDAHAIGRAQQVDKPGLGARFRRTRRGSEGG
jgi:bifunctional UDP-N-acetylglucosamine pyrophosphorylase/glucosamine-1-phosphate N-acetyltransferase